jgi:RimJ/RimL family protein N-acetyltransferase
MKGPTPAQARLIRDLKAPFDRFTLPIRSPDGHCRGALVPVTAFTAKDPGTVEAMARWRAAHRDAFLTVFHSTPERTRTYIHKVLLPDPGRILFLVRDAETASMIGNVGLNNVDGEKAELDNVLRGEDASRRDLMHLAMLSLLHWTFRSLSVASVYLNVLAHNSRATRAYLKVGFAEVDRHPLLRQATDDGFRLVRSTEASGDPSHLQLATMEVTQAAFYRFHPWLASSLEQI